MAASHCRRTTVSRNTELSRKFFSIGHSVHPLKDFLKLLTVAGPRVYVLDVRSSPRSRRPWFNADRLAATLTAHGHTYEWQPELGGRQSTDFYTYMGTQAFHRGIARVLKQSRPTVLLCSEGNPQECHRWLIAEALAAHGHHVHHILKTGKLLPHGSEGRA